MVEHKVETEVLRSLEEWAEDFEDPDEAVLFAGPKGYSPRQIVEEVRNGTKMGKELLDAYRENKERYGVWFS